MPLPHPRAVASGALLLVLVSCGDDSTAPRRDGPLTAQEASALALQLGLPFSAAMPASVFSLGANGARLGTDGDPFHFVVDVEVRCERGGTARVTAAVEGDVDHAAESVTLDLEGTFTPDDCGHRVRGVTIWTSAVGTDDPSLRVNAHVETRNGEPVGVHTATVTGRFAWRASDGRSGQCTVDYAAAVNYTTRRTIVNGEFCGTTIKFDGPLTN